MSIEELMDISKEMTESYVIEKYFKLDDVETPLFEVQAWEVAQYYDKCNELEKAIIFTSATIVGNKIYEFIYDNKHKNITFKEFYYREESSTQVEI